MKTNIDKIVTSLKGIPVTRTKFVTEMKIKAHRAFRREANRLAKEGNDEVQPKIRMTDWDVW